MKKLFNHVYINQEGIEDIVYEDLKVLSRLFDKELDDTSNLVGTVHCAAVPTYLINMFNSYFPEFIILTDYQVIFDALRTDDSTKAANDKAFLKVFYEKELCADPTLMTSQEAEAVVSGKTSFGTQSRDGDSIFQNNTEITSFNALQYFTGLKYLGSAAFRQCINLTEVTLPPVPIEISGGSSSNGWSGGAFYGCTKLQRVNNSQYITKLWARAFQGCSALQEIDLSGVVAGTNNGEITNSGNKQIANNISPYAFYGCSSLERVTLPQGLKEFSGYCFQNCTKLALTQLPSTLTTIGDSAFNGTSCNFESLPESVTSISGFPWANATGTQVSPLYNSHYMSWGGYQEYSIGNRIINDDIISDGSGSITLKGQIISPRAFQNNTSITKVQGNGVIGNNAFVFQGCTNLQELPLQLLQTTTSLGERIFNGCSGLINTTVELPENIATIGVQCFNGSNVHTLITYGKPSGTDTFSNCGIKKVIFKKPFTMEYHYQPFNGSQIREVVFAEGQDMNQGYFFQNAKRLRKVNLNSVKTIHSPAGNHLANTYCLKYVEFNNLETIGSTILNAVTGLKQMVINQNTIPTFNGTPTINGNSTQLRFYVPDTLVSSYQEAQYWNAFQQRILPMSQLNIKEYQGVDFFGNKYYDTKRIFTENCRLEIDFEKWQDSQNFICGAGNFRFQHFRNDAFNSTNWGLSNYTKNKLIITNKNVSVNGVSKWSGNYTGLSTTLSMYLGNFNNNGSPYSGRNANACTIYKFLWYDGPYLVQAWLGNENGGFDIYADEDIEPQEDDVKYPLSALADKDETLAREGGIIAPTYMNIVCDPDSFYSDYKMTLSIESDGVGDCIWSVTGNATLNITEGTSVVITSTGSEGDQVTVTAVSRIDGTTTTSRTWTMKGNIRYSKSIKFDGNTVFDLGYMPKSNTRIEADVMLSAVTDSTQALFGTRQIINSTDSYGLYMNTNKIYYFLGNSGNTDSGLTLAANTRNTITFDSNAITCGNSNVELIDKSHVTALNSLVLGSVNNMGNSSNSSVNGGFSLFTGTLYAFKIYEGDTLIADWRPGRENNTLYDLISEQTITNLNSGTATIVPYD